MCRRWRAGAERVRLQRVYRTGDPAARSGYVISKSAIHRYGQKIERRFGAIRAATEAARMLTEGAADDQDARSEAVIALIQTELFDSIVQLQEAEEGEIDHKDRVALLSKVAKKCGHAVPCVGQPQKYQADIRREAREELLREQTAALDKALKAQGLGEDQIRFWREKKYWGSDETTEQHGPYC